MVKMSNVEVMDVCGACCLSTAGVKDRLEELPEGEILEVVLDEKMYDALTKLAGEKDCEILETTKEDKAVRVRLQKKMLKVKPSKDYPTEGGSYLRGNDFSPVAVGVLLNAPRPLANQPDTKDIKIPPDIENLVKTAVETGAALAGTLQTENIGIEKLISNVVGNPNIRYLVLCGEEVEGHNTGDALKALLRNGIDDRRTIIGTKAPTPYLFNIPLEAIERFRNQVTLIDFLGEMNKEVISKAVWSCYQEPEKPVQFKDYTLSDPGAYSEPAISCRLTGMVEHPEEVEEWELDEIVKNIEKGKAIVEDIGGEVVEELGPEEKSKINAFVGKRLSGIAQELLDIAELLGQPVEVPVEKVMPAAPAKEAIIPTHKMEVEEDEVSLYFSNQLRAYNAMFAVFDACVKDMCNNGCTFPSVVISTGKRLRKLKTDLGNSQIIQERKQLLGEKIDKFLERLDAMPQDTSRPCQKTVGNCTIGPGCFVKGAADFIKLVTEPAPPSPEGGKR
ncbi:MAG: tetrahydromethanopterin S-methyltransferase subunit A [Methanobacteriota archaeon]